jgi:hypothetical protein
VREIARVAVDGSVIGVPVPVLDQAIAADPILFSGVDSLQQVFQPYIHEELWAEEQPPLTTTNKQRIKIARIVFRLRHQ